MTALYRPEAFETLTDDPWDEERARAAIRAIVADTDAAFDADRLWPADEWDAWTCPLPLKNLYVGAAGVILALDALRRRGYAESSLDLAAAALRTLELWRAEPDFPVGIELPQTARAALLEGEIGPLIVAWRLAPDSRLTDELHMRFRENASSEAGEVMWGAPGTLLAARTMLDWTGERRWAEAWCEAAEKVWDARDAGGLWTQRLYGEVYRGLGPLHGAVGNVLALLGGRELLADERREALRRDTAAALARTAVEEDGFANWSGDEGGALLAADGQIRLQWCQGAPGIVACAADYLDEELLLAGAQLAWRAGPSGMEKGPCICHGSAGTGYAFLKTFDRTGDERWLERARRFAMHALQQVERRGRGRYSLWTGDLGVALFTADCIEARSAYPIVEAW